MFESPKSVSRALHFPNWKGGEGCSHSLSLSLHLFGNIANLHTPSHIMGCLTWLM